MVASKSTKKKNDARRGPGASPPRPAAKAPPAAAAPAVPPAVPAAARRVVDADPAAEEHGPVGETEAQPSLPFHVVGIGASAGGLESCSHLLRRLPGDTGMAFVLVQHLDPARESPLAELLARTTTMTVVTARQDAPIEPDHVYVVPHDAMMVIERGRIRLQGRPPPARSMLVDSLFRSMAADLGTHALGVVLSGMGSDGTLGLEAIKSAGGITLVESERTAAYDAMPRSAADSGQADFVLPVEELADELSSIARQLRGGGAAPAHGQDLLPVGGGGAAPAHGQDLLPVGDGELKQIFALLRAARGVDFTYYRHSTIKRRILRRMVLHRLQSLGEYVRYLHDRPAEVEALYQDVLIKVTQFFRDPDLFAALASTVFPAILKARVADAPIRIWVPGCSTGEEPYSIAMGLLELLGERRTNAPLQIFATDISELAIEKARAGVYPSSISLDVSPERLRRFFVRTEDRYVVSKAIRDVCIFAKHDLTRDPPFAKMDLISCRNLLIYLEPVLQKKVMPMFHYALGPAGFLALGTSETVGAFADLFSLVDKRNKVYLKNAAAPRFNLDFGRARGEAAGELARGPEEAPDAAPSLADIQKEADRVVMTRYAPAGVVINGEMQILQFRGKTGPYLEPAPGEASLNVLKMAREGLMLELRGAIQKARRLETPVRAEGLHIRVENVHREVAIEVVPLHGVSEVGQKLLGKQWFLVVFEDTSGAAGEAPPARGGKKGGARALDADLRVAKLQQDLTATKEHLQAIIEEQEATNEELQSANEEILSSNEELQSINEELQTAKEELQSTNEELSTINDELETRNVELSRVNNDLSNLLSNVNIAIVMLSGDLRIRRFTPTAEHVLNLIPSDVGRPIGDIQPKIDVPDLEALLSEVVRTGGSREREVRDRDGHWYSLRIRPYRTADNKVDGAVIFLIDIDALKRNPRA